MTRAVFATAAPNRRRKSLSRSPSSKTLGQKYNPIAKDGGGFSQTTLNVIPRGAEKHPMLHNHANQFRIQHRHLTLRRGDGLQRRHVIVRLPQLEQKLDLPAGTIQHHHFLPRQQLRIAVGDENRPLLKFQVFLRRFAAVVAGLFADFLTPPRGHFRRHSHRNQSASKPLFLAQQDHGVHQAVFALLPQKRRQIKAFSRRVENFRAVLQTRNPIGVRFAHATKPIQRKIAQIEHGQRSCRRRSFRDLALGVAGAAGFDLPSEELARHQAPQDLDFHRRPTGVFRAAATWKSVGEFVWQHQAGAVADPNVREFLQQRRGCGFCGQRLRDGLFEYFFEEQHEFVRKPIFDRLLGYMDPQFGGHCLIVAVFGSRSEQHRQNQRPRQRCPGELALPA